MNQDMNARLLRGTLATVRKALKVRGLKEVDELELYEPITVHSSSVDGSEVGAGGVDAIGIEDKAEATNADVAIAGPASKATAAAPEPRRADDPEADALFDQTAEELFAEMPWEPGEAPRSPTDAESANVGGEASRHEVEKGAAEFLSDMPWDGAGTKQEEPSMSERSAVERSMNERKSDAQDDAQDFFENLNWDGDTDAHADDPTAESDPADPADGAPGERFSVDPDGGEVPDHVRRVVELRERERVPAATDDAVDRSSENENRRSEGGKE
ncbi:hypothetical protein HFP89_14370 [Wenzhouxiangella sp. XN79A]|uniref:hypothetical protein n=1 Tax=Wenzhouxiangella sp. XN79A TaxID=2724193 RepID=UPI00144A8924|nr:hypothetical protein [Wenzhouxiangella sp. XN79A]NKI36352.1 hypothetical protein [Wenzhouxiangella sp. XN79A]